MERKLTIAIDAEDFHCGGCRYLNFSANSRDHWYRCTLLKGTLLVKDRLAGKIIRKIECHNLEVKPSPA